MTLIPTPTQRKCLSGTTLLTMPCGLSGCTLRLYHKGWVLDKLLLQIRAENDNNLDLKITVNEYCCKITRPPAPNSKLSRD